MSETSEAVSDADAAAELEIVLTRHHYRMVSAGIPMCELDAARDAAPTRWSEWLAHWNGRGDHYAALADAAETAGHEATAALHWVTSSLCYHFGQFMVYELPEEKQAAANARVGAYRRAAPLLRPVAQIHRAIAGESAVPYVLREPTGPGSVPMVVIVPGVEATKEEMHGWEGFFVDRGIAAVALDGPGQGEQADVELTPASYVAAVSAVVDDLVSRPNIDGERVGIMGVSLGGLMASMTVAKLGRFSAAAEIGGTFDTESRWERANRLSRRGHQHVTHSSDEAETLSKIAGWTMAGLTDGITCPFLVVHGEDDRIVPVDQAQMYANSIQHAEIVVVPGGNHVCNNFANTARPMIADWFADRFGGAR